jgi:phospholipase D1/2
MLWKKKEADMPDRDRPEEREESRPFHSPILVSGRNCWRLESVEKAAFLVDGEAYFQAFRDVALHAKHSIMIVGWDVDTRTELVRGVGEEPAFPRSWANL